VDRELVHEAGARSLDVDALELILGSDTTLSELGGLALDLAQLLHHLLAQDLVDLDDLKLGLGDAPLGLSDRGDELALLAVEIGRLAFQSSLAADRDQALLIEPADTGELLLD
jgi:hypothetical protein